jgi:FKBP-type peptidyl-prolyl cis-trans isomerase
MRMLGVLVWTITLVACSSPGSDVPDQPPEMPADIADHLYVTSPTGLKHHDLTIGTGIEAQNGKQITVHYTGWLTTGKIFDSSIKKKRPFSLTLGGGQVIKGWDEGIVGMRVGGHRQLSIPPDLAYGPGGYAGVIPPNATLIFEIYLIEVK